ncbi:hypothetical protein LSM04_002102 [Trypanosoma melophagium]|uniref:uncharacterized protein n=1 Tax=Trypanosoma melophagium TaxID=715481 RepID=UPI00351A15B0|nr:hypothetical protein LSM04_002102 [Trypanosoma melophagium]
METEFQHYTLQRNEQKNSLHKGSDIRSSTPQRDAANNTGSCSDDDNDDSKNNHCSVGAALVTSLLSPTRKKPRLTSPHSSQSNSSNSNNSAEAFSCHSPTSYNDESADCVTVMVPTMFTTAAGRPICVRETRHIKRGSPYWKLLFECPLREGDVLSSTDIVNDNQYLNADGGLSDIVEEEATTSKEEKRATIPLLPIWRRKLQRTEPLSSLSSFLPTPIVECYESRSHSCPPRVQNSRNKSGNREITTINSQKTCSSTNEKTFPYSSFTRADGSMIYLSPGTTLK